MSDMSGNGGQPRDPGAPTGAPPQQAAPQQTERDPLRSSMTAKAWLAVVVLAVVLILLIVFIAQNTKKVQVSFLGWQGNTPLAVALLIAAVAGLVLATIAGALRILQLRRRVRRERKRH